MIDKEKFGVRGILTPIIKPTYDCNLACKYCYVGEKVERGKMSPETLGNSIKKVAIFNGKNKESCFIWHGGEPLLVGLDFYRCIMEIQKEMGKEYRFKNEIQTNGTLINEETADFFKEYNFSLGLSLDGPQELNDKTRLYKKDRNGSKGTFTDVLTSIHLLKQKRINVGIIVVLNRHNINNMPLVYQFLKTNKLNARFNPLLKFGRAVENYEDLVISPDEYKKAKLKLFDIWANDEAPVHLDCFEGMIRNILKDGHSSECTFSDSCQKDFISIGPQGDVYACDELSSAEEFRYGNINENSLEEILLNPTRQELLKRKENIEECKSCEYQKLCYGGCMSHAYAFTGSIMSRDPYCSAYKDLFERISHEIFKN